MDIISNILLYNSHYYYSEVMLHTEICNADLSKFLLAYHRIHSVVTYNSIDS